MENKKIVKILLKDMGELEELISEMKANRRFDALEMEFIHTRAKGILQLLQLFETKEEKAPLEIHGEEENVKEIKETVAKEIQKAEEIHQEKQPEGEAAGEELPPEYKEEKRDAEISVSEAPEEEISEKDNKEDDEMLEEDSVKTEANSRLGDSFLKGKSVNDLITEQHKLEFKLSNRPVSSIQSAIGINDRFQYIRELFDGDNKKFVEAVKILDSMQNIKDAVDYLRNNYKWKKNETSLKFVNLVKRRFQNTTD